MLHSPLLSYLNRLSPSRGKRRPQRAGPTHRGSTVTRISLEPLEDRLALSGYTFTDITEPNAVPSPGVVSTSVTGINSRGQIVGDYYDANGNVHGFLLSAGQYTTIDPPNSAATVAFGINAQGQIVGGYGDANGNVHGFLLSAGQYTQLDDPNGLGTLALGINDLGQIMGQYYDANGNSPGFLLSGGQYMTLPDPPNALPGFSTFSGINAGGQIVGYYYDANLVVHGFLLSGGQYTQLDDPNAGTQQFVGTFALGINDHGQIVGSYHTGNSGGGFLLSGGQYTSFDAPNSLPGSTGGSGINDRGQIVGGYIDTHGGFHSFLADPVHGNSAADPASSPGSVTVLDPAAATPSVVLVTVPLAQLTPTPPLAITGPANPDIQVGESLGALFNGATTAVLMAPSISSGAGAIGHQDTSIFANDLFMSHFNDPFTKEAATDISWQ
jgi:probable HAF family extracellular repeat protein